MSAAAPSPPYISQPLRRREDGKFLTGKGRYADVKTPGTLLLAILRAASRADRICATPARSIRAPSTNPV